MAFSARRLPSGVREGDVLSLRKRDGVPPNGVNVPSFVFARCTNPLSLRRRSQDPLWTEIASSFTRRRGSSPSTHIANHEDLGMAFSPPIDKESRDPPLFLEPRRPLYPSRSPGLRRVARTSERNFGPFRPSSAVAREEPSHSNYLLEKKRNHPPKKSPEPRLENKSEKHQTIADAKTK